MWPDGILVMPFMGRSRQQPSTVRRRGEHGQQDMSPNDNAASASLSAMQQTTNNVNLELNTADVTNYESNVTEADTSDSADNTVLHISAVGEEDTSIA